MHQELNFAFHCTEKQKKIPLATPILLLLLSTASLAPAILLFLLLKLLKHCSYLCYQPPSSTDYHVVNNLPGTSSTVALVVISLFGPYRAVASVVNSLYGPSSIIVSPVGNSLSGPSSAVVPVVTSLNCPCRTVSLVLQYCFLTASLAHPLCCSCYYQPLWHLQPCCSCC